MIIKSILDTDLYKITMAMAVAHLYSDVEVEYEFINRGKTPFPPGFAARLRQEVAFMANLRLMPDEEMFLREKCHYLRRNYIDMLRGYRYDPSQVNIRQIGTELFVTISGPWYLTILWEVPLLAMISELYYEMMNLQPLVVAADGDAPNWRNKLSLKLRRMSDAGCLVSEFGTRRRHSYAVQDEVVATMKKHSCTVGTSNVHLAQKHGLSPHGTMAHEYIMAHACLFGYREATKRMLQSWVQVFEGELGTALPDTFTSGVFFRDFNTLYAKLFDGVRHDSGDWKWFTLRTIDHYTTLRIDPQSKHIIYSDSLDDKTAVEIQQFTEGKIRPRFGIGTYLTNDVGHSPLNIVIKLTQCNGRPAVKLSDSVGKELGRPEAISHCKYDLGI